MENSFKFLLTFVLVAVVRGRPLIETFLGADPMQLITEAVGFYNGELHSDVVFKLYKDEYEYKVGPKGQKQANFTIKESVCQKSENRTIGSCELKLEGLEKRCTASKNELEKSFSVVCTSVTVETKKDPRSEYMEDPGNQEDDYADQSEYDLSYEDHVITMEENHETFLEEEDEEEKRIIDEFLASKTQNTEDKHLPSRTTKRKLQPGQFLGRFLCLECFFEVLPRK